MKTTTILIRVSSILAVAGMLCVVSPISATAAKPNVLFIAVDDLRPQLKCYGATEMHTPNIDRLASQGVLFHRAYCMVPTCGASRASLLTGIRPTRKRFVNYLTWAEKDAAGITTLNTHFKDHGYFTVSNGKVFHHPRDNSQGWSEPAWRPKGVPTYQLESNRATQAKRSKMLGSRGRGPAFESADVRDDAYADGKILNKSIKDLQRLAKKQEPFFLAVGFLKPHLPFVAPKKYWDLYDPQSIHLPPTYHRPKNAPSEAIHSWGELRSYADIPAKGPLSDAAARRLIHGYYACVSYTDAQIGKLLDELRRLGLSDNTIVVFWGDHGWNLGEHTLWCKHCCFETSMHAPLIVAAPGIKGGVKTDGLTEFIDIYPSLCDLAKLPHPKHLEGKSFVPLMKDPSLKWKFAAVGRYRNGDTIRTDRYRFTEYANQRGKHTAQMLYDHKTDPGEDTNISEETQQKNIVQKLAVELRRRKGKELPFSKNSATAPDLSTLRSALTFHADYQNSFDAAFAKGDAKLYTATSLDRKDGKPGNQRADATIIPNGRFGKALRFSEKSKQVVYYQTDRNLPYRSKSWSGTISLWMRLDPDKDLKPGYADPIQITDKRWNDAAFFLDFTKDDKPRHFRLGAFSDLKFWNPKNVKWEEFPVEKRPMVIVRKPSFSKDRWTHVVVSFSKFNADGEPGKATLYLNGVPQGTLARPQRFTWDSRNAAIMLGLSYIGDIDDLAIFDQALTGPQVQQLFKLKNGVSDLHN